MNEIRLEAKQATSVPRAWWWIGLTGLLGAGLLPVIGHQLRSGRVRCALDGQEIEPLYRVAVVENDGARHDFCCIACAELWLSRTSATPRQVLVTGEATGQVLNASDAYFVRSSVTSNAPTRDRRHVFARRDVAESHAQTFHGRVLLGDERPFRVENSSSTFSASQNRGSIESLQSS